jgi:hypothetical protein
MPASAVLPSSADAVETMAAEPRRGKGAETALREFREVFRRARELISDCECSVVSLAAQLALRVDPDYAPRVDPGDKTRRTRERDGPEVIGCAAKAIA